MVGNGLLEPRGARTVAMCTYKDRTANRANNFYLSQGMKSFSLGEWKKGGKKNQEGSDVLLWIIHLRFLGLFTAHLTVETRNYAISTSTGCLSDTQPSFSIFNPQPPVLGDDLRWAGCAGHSVGDVHPACCLLPGHAYSDQVLSHCLGPLTVVSHNDKYWR